MSAVPVPSSVDVELRELKNNNVSIFWSTLSVLKYLSIIINSGSRAISFLLLPSASGCQRLTHFSLDYFYPGSISFTWLRSFDLYRWKCPVRVVDSDFILLLFSTVFVYVSSFRFGPHNKTSLREPLPLARQPIIYNPSKAMFESIDVSYQYTHKRITVTPHTQWPSSNITAAIRTTSSTVAYYTCLSVYFTSSVESRFHDSTNNFNTKSC